MEVTSVVITCCNTDCGISFAVPTWWERGKRENHSRFYCPNGHGQVFNAESDTEKLRRERDRLAQRVAERDDEIKRQRELRQGTEKRLAAAKGVVTRFRNRIGNGVCPCCTRSFTNLRSHMATEHPEFRAEAAE
jgi:hypothetical protein